MKAILYMLAHSAKNAVIDVLRHPLRGIVYLFLIVSLVYGVVLGFTMSAEIDMMEDMRILSGAYLAILYFVSIPVMLKGLNMGSRFFSQSDVSNTFVAPISEKKVLVYGIGRQLATMLFLVLCFLSYGGIAMRYFRIPVSSAVLLIAGLFGMLVFVQLMTILIFCICNGHRVRSAIVKGLIYFLPIYALGAVVIHLFVNGITYENFLQAISLPLLEYVPIIGWIHALIFGIMQGNISTVILYGVLLLIMAVLAIVVLCVSKLDYYEDVLQKTESYFEAVNAYREGKVTESMMLGNKKINIRKTGLHHGQGATAFFFKHNREGFRRSRLPFFNINTIVLLSVSLLIAFGMKTAVASIMPTLIVLLVVVITSYIQFFFSTAGDWVKELNKPYIYLVPDSGVKKLIMASMTTLLKPLTDAVIAFGILG
ncbi:MAG: putative ABC exporter domain-containing protein, partial [Acutalibacteraceae bacterium]